MPSLHEMQSGFTAALLDPARSHGAPGIRAAGISPSLRLGIYRNNVFQNYARSLTSIYPAVERLIGRGCFAHLCREYCRRCRSRSGDVGQQGARFADFLGAHPIARELAYLPDVARLEWLIEESFYEADCGPLDLRRLEKVHEAHHDSLRFLLAPSVRLLRSAFPVEQIWRFTVQPDSSDESLQLSDGPCHLLVRRQDFAVEVESVSEAEFALLRALQVGYALGEAYSYACAIYTQFDLADFLQRRVSDNVLADIAQA